MNLAELLQMTAPKTQAAQAPGLGPIMQFLSAFGQGPQSAQLPQTNMPDHSGMIMQAGLAKKAQKDNYAAHLQAKADMEAQQAAAIKGHESELSQDPQIQAMLTSGNPQLVAYAMKLAEDEKQQQIKAQYNENPTYQKWLNASPREKEQLEQYLKLKIPATNIYTDSMKPPVGYRWNGDDHTSVLPLIGGPEDRAAQPLTESQAKAMSNLSVMEETSKQYDEFLARTRFDPTKMSMKDSMAQGLMSIDSPLADAFGLTPSIEHQGRRMASPEALEYFTTIGRWNEIFGRDKSGGAIKNPEYRAWLMQYWPGPNDSLEIVANKTKARKAYEQSLMLTANPENRQQRSTGQYSNLITDEMRQDGFANIVGKVENPKMDPSAVSPKGAFGLAQTMPSTFREMMPDGDPSNPEHQLEAGHRYWRQALEFTGGDLKRAAAYYQGGSKGLQAFDRGVYRSDGNLNTKQYGDKAFGSGSQALVAKKQFDYNEARKQAAQPNSPANKEKKARLEAMLKEAEQY